MRYKCFFVIVVVVLISLFLEKELLIGNNSTDIGQLCKMKVLSVKSGKKISSWDFLRKGDRS